MYHSCGIHPTPKFVVSANVMLYSCAIVLVSAMVFSGVMVSVCVFVLACIIVLVCVMQYCHSNILLCAVGVRKGSIQTYKWAFGGMSPLVSHNFLATQDESG